MHTVVQSYEPTTAKEALTLPEWKSAMEAEMDSIVRNGTWDLMDRPSHRQVIGVKWVFKTKFHADGSLDKHKARLVAKGYSQIEGVDYEETYAPTARYTSIRTVLALSAPSLAGISDGCQVRLPQWRLARGGLC